MKNKKKIIISFAIIVVVVIIGVGFLAIKNYNSALETTKRNYKEYGYDYARSELGILLEDKTNGVSKYEYDDLDKALDFLYQVEYGVTFNEYMGID